MDYCGRLIAGQNSACVDLVRRYFQKAVIINKEDIKEYSINKTDFSNVNPTPTYNVQFKLKANKKGYLFQASENGSSILGTYDKSNSELGGRPQYKHNVSILIVGASEEQKTIITGLDLGRYVVALQLADGTIEVYGVENGLSTTDYTYDIQGGGGGAVITLSSSENSPEGNVPLVYKAQSNGDAKADFEALFAGSDD